MPPVGLKNLSPTYVKISIWEYVMKLSGLTMAVLATLVAPTIASAQGAAATTATSQPLAPGATVYDPQGGVVGKIDSIAGDNVVIDTGTSKATLPKNAFGSSAKGHTVTATKAQIDAMVAAASAKSNAALEAALVTGAQVFGKAGNLIGTIKSIEGDQVVLDRTEGPVSLARQAFALGTNGLTISMTSAELDAAAKAASQSR
jgi:preprotein translocase subunit YajC